MPMYEYECKACGSDFDMLRSMSQSDDDITCLHCGSPKILRKLSLFASHSKDGLSASASSAFAGGDSCSTGMCGCNGSACSL